MKGPEQIETRPIKAGFETVRIKRARWWEPAGGETGVPRCLAEVHNLPLLALSFIRCQKQHYFVTSKLA